jgi:NAD(P)-dependent dehydrogenase (short-subunit alcohol dehydrogenase family)
MVQWNFSHRFGASNNRIMGEDAKMSGLNFTGRTAIVTGAASGIGRAVALRFAQFGARVFLLDKNSELLTQSVREIQDLVEDAEVEGLCVDLTDGLAVDALLAGIKEKSGQFHHLVNSAVNFVAAGVDATESDWEAAFAVNVTAASLLTAKFSRDVGGDGTVVNISSISAHAAQPNRWTYNASKAAILALTRGQALDLAVQGIRVNSVSPGWIWTPEVEKAAGGDRLKWEPIWGQYHILQRLGEPREIADAVLFLSSPMSSFVTGSELLVDGGYSALGPEGLGETAKFAARVGKEEV